MLGNSQASHSSVAMERWSGRVALVTGASSGIGAATASSLVKSGMQVVGLARRDDKVKELAASLKGAPGKLHAVKGDVSKEDDVLRTFAWIKENLGGVDVLINNAGVINEGNLHDGELGDWRNMLDVNVLGLSLCTREAVKDMRSRGVNDGHIIHINSVAGHIVSNRPGFLMYSASKHAVTALAEGIRKELVRLGTRIRVTSISPGLVKSEIFERDNMKDSTSDKMYAENYMEAQDIADAVVYVLGTPERVQIQELIIKPTGANY
ncbi:farnesol dehydrogenase isoform X2 [Anabrus simplex]|uniref:farnesol dehydrogenase isoform X2 n=1 Tax=Anabrus simplex TaxID=316456 RepID=UPI0035A275D2